MLAETGMVKGRIFEEQHFKVEASSILNAGLGLFACVGISPGDTIGYYTGMILSDEDVNSPPYAESDYVLWVCKDCNIVGEGPDANYVRFINHHEEPNCRIVTSSRWKTARIEAIKYIAPFEEIFINYGPYYWEHYAGQKSPEKPCAEESI